MEIKVCEKCKNMTLKLYHVDDYSEQYSMVCGTCFLDILRTVVTKNEERLPQGGLQ